MILSRRRIFLWSLGSILVILIVLILVSQPSHKLSNDFKHSFDRSGQFKHFGLVNEADVAVHLKANQKQAEYIDKKGVHVVVGKYVGNALGSSKPNFTSKELNANNFHPQPGAGDNGEPVYLHPNEERIAKRFWHINKFNIVASDKIPLNRTLPDIRKPACKGKFSEDRQSVQGLPRADIIIVFHNEAWSTLLRTIHSVINTSPRSLLKEIILVDDRSNRTFLGSELEQELGSLSVPTKVIRMKKRVGLINARLRGASQATADVLIFLDAHCEATPGWLVPLLSRIAESPTSVVCPVIDIINDDTFAFTRSFSLHWGAFNWELHFRWFTMSQDVIDAYAQDHTKPYKTPAMAGGLFAIDRDFFYQMGSYDEKMDIWGGENLELSFRIWMCGGSVEICPCSHVGHVFRKASPYEFPREGGVGAVLNSNLARVALVWMDKYAKFYFKINGQAKEAAALQDVSERQTLRQSLKCQDFKWYLDTVWPQHFFPTEDRLFGTLKHRQSGLCVQKPFSSPGSSSQPSGAAILSNCASGKEFHVNQVLVISEKGFIMTDESLCLDSPGARDIDDPTVRFQACSESDRQIWKLEPERHIIIHTQSGKCLNHPTSGTSDILTLALCSGQPEQQWIFEPKSWED